ncbi:MAG: Hsp33 family molecular chaperone HslO [Alphaproteobacteria bacterium]
MSALSSLHDDLVLPFHLDAGAFRGRVVRLGPAFEQVLAPHDHPETIAGMMGETLALAAALAGMLKYQGIFTLQMQGDGPVGLLMADVTSDGDLRGHARYDRTRVEAAGDGSHRPLARLLGKGHLAFTVDQGPDTDRYQGIVSLSGGTLSECARQYFLRSEQLETVLRLAAGPVAGSHWRAGAFLLQRMPQDTGGSEPETVEEAWREASVLMASVTDTELLDPHLSSEALLYRVFHGGQPRVAPAHSLRASCRCSRERVARTLGSFPRHELETMRDEDGMVTVTCEFCKMRYDFTGGDLDTLCDS